MKNKLALWCALLMSISFSHGEIVQPLSVGSLVPSHIWHKIPKKKNAKLIILDFWATYCANCYQNFPEMERLQRKFSQDVQVVLVNSWESDKEIKKRLGRINNQREKNNLPSIKIPNLTQINGDEILKQLFPCEGPPHHVWVNAKGKVIAISYHYNTTEKNIQSFLINGGINLSRRIDTIHSFLLKQGLFTTNGSLKSPFYSGMTRYSPDIGFTVGSNNRSFKDTVEKLFRYTIICKPIIDLYRLVYTNPYDDSTRFVNLLRNRHKYEEPASGDDIDEWSKHYVFGYEIQLPLEYANDWKRIMLEDINRFFAIEFGIEGRFERKEFQCYVVVKSEDKLFPFNSKGEEKFEHSNGYYNWTSTSIKSVIKKLNDLFERDGRESFLIDEVGDVDIQVSLNVNESINNINTIKEQLEKYGLTVKEEKRVFSVFILKNKK